MAITDILHKIESDTKDQVKKIKQDAEKKMKELQASHDETLKEMKNAILSEAKKTVSDLQRQAEVSKNLSENAAMLSAKRQIMDEIYDDVRNAYETMDSASYTSFLASLLSHVPADFKEAEVEVSSKRKKEMEGALKTASMSFKISSNEPSDSVGFILRSASHDLDLTLGSLLKRVREEYEIELNTMLFS